MSISYAHAVDPHMWKIQENRVPVEIVQPHGDPLLMVKEK
jgi:hypothetical protein